MIALQASPELGSEMINLPTEHGIQQSSTPGISEELIRTIKKFFATGYLDELTKGSKSKSLFLDIDEGKLSGGKICMELSEGKMVVSFIGLSQSQTAVVKEDKADLLNRLAQNFSDIEIELVE